MVLPPFMMAELIYRGINVMRRTVDLYSSGREQVLACRAAGRSVVFVAWHAHDSVNLGVYRELFGYQTKAVIMVPETDRGRVIGHLGQRMGLDVIRLDPDQGSTRCARSIIDVINLVRDGYDALLAVDGPRGPGRIVKPGAALIAQRSGAVIVPMAAAASPAVRLEFRWDKHLLPAPLARVGIHFGSIIDPCPPGGPSPCRDELRERIAEGLHEGTLLAEQFCRARRPIAIRELYARTAAPGWAMRGNEPKEASA
jgi:lysophospholipid acyltransferase (LPLAT)-like uncharacterized protein